MLTNKEMIGLQAEKHDLIKGDEFQSIEERVLHLIHTYAYMTISKLSHKNVVLDLGCNTGYGTDIVSNNSKLTIGVDVSENAIEHAKSKYKKEGVEFFTVDGKSLPFEDSKFDIVASFQVIEHIVDHTDYFREIKRVLKDDGIVIFTTPNASIRLDEGMKPWNEFHVKEYTHQDLMDYLSKEFKYVDVFGMMAEKEIYSVEYGRVRKACEKAKLMQSKNTILRLFINNVKKIIPKTFKNKIISLLVRPSKNIDINTSGIVLDLEKIGYSDDVNEKDIALDFMAICSGNKDVLDEAKKTILHS